MKNRLKWLGAAFLTWSLFSALWTVFNINYGGEDAPILDHAIVGGTAMADAGVLAVGVWWLSGRMPWPRPMTFGFPVVHLAAAALFGLLWIVMGLGIASVRLGRNLFANPGETQALGWRMLMGIFFYGLIAGVSYAVRIHRDLVEQERIAAEARTLAAEARLHGLRSQLRPHFLFNALHTVSALVERDPRSAKAAVQRIGDLLRYSLDGGDGVEEDVPLEREWDFARDYLEMERLRLGDRLRVRADMEPEALRVRVPAFLVQTLVENVVRHAVTPREEGAEMRVTAAVEGGRLRLTVEDDGPGRDAHPATNGTGKGLHLLRERLRTRFGDEAALETESPDAGGFRVRVLLPAEPA